MKNAEAFRLTPSGLVNGESPVHKVLAPQSMQPEKQEDDNGTTKLLMKLALTNAFNEKGEVRKEEGYVKDSNILELVGFALSKDACLKGLPEFIEVMRSAGITEELVTNDLVKQFLVMKKPIVFDQTKPVQDKPPTTPPVTLKQPESYVEARIKPKKPLKRLKTKAIPVLEEVRPLSASRKRQQDPPIFKRKPLKRNVKSLYANWDASDSDMEEA